MSLPIQMNSAPIQIRAPGSNLSIQNSTLIQGAQVATQTDIFESSGDRPGQAGREMAWHRQLRGGNVESQTSARFFTGSRGDGTDPADVEIFTGVEAEYTTQTTIRGKDMDTVVSAGLRGSAGQDGALKLQLEVEPERLSLDGQAMSKMGAQAELDGGLELRSHGGSAAKANATVGIGPQLGLDLNGGLGRDNQEGETRLRLQGELKVILGLELSAELVLQDKEIEGACRNLLGQTAGNVVAGTVTGTLDCLPRFAHTLKCLANATGEVAQSTISLLT